MAEVQILAPSGKEMVDRIGSPDNPGLRRNTLTEDGKRWQLWGKGIRGPEADKIIASLYPQNNS